MPITTLDTRTALLVIDLQRGLATLPTAEPVKLIAARAGVLAAAFRKRDLPVVLITADGVAPGRTDAGAAEPPRLPAGFSGLLPELGAQDTDHLMAKQRWGAFHDARLSDRLTALGITQLVVCGVATSIGVESTARAAYDHGFHVTIPTDVVTDVDPVSHANSIRAVFPALGETGTSAELIAILGQA